MGIEGWIRSAFNAFFLFCIKHCFADMELSDFTDEDFDAFYPIKMRKLSATHWTPVAIARKAIEFLVDRPGVKVLDLGSGTGKFCLVAASHSQAMVTGVEQRENLVRLSRKMAENYKIENVDFVHGDIKTIDFKEYEAFYFFNSFEENINLTDKLAAENTFDFLLYQEYCQFLHAQFDLVPKGTKIVTYCGQDKEIPESYTLVKSQNKGKLKFWRKRE